MEIIDKLYTKKLLMNLVKSAVKADSLSERSANIVEDFVDGTSVEELCAKHNLSRSRIHKIVDSAMFSLNFFVSKLVRKNLELEVENKKLTAEVSMLSLIIEDLKKNEKSTFEESSDKDYNPKAFSMLIRHLNFSTRALRLCHMADIDNAGELMSYTSYDLLKFRDVGKKTINEIRVVLKKHGWKLRGED